MFLLENNKQTMAKEKDKDFINPIDPDKITETPNTLLYPHHVGSAIVKPEDQGKLKGRALSAMDQQTDQQLSQIYEQMQLLAQQASKIQERKAISERIYMAEMRFEPLISHVYHLYSRDNSSYLLSMVAPEQWGRSGTKLTFVATVKLLADHTWEVLKKNPEVEF
jgi:hypothetical protein